MAKVVVLTCELDGDFDSAENRVVTANVCGHRVELCKKHRVMLLTQVGVSEEHAVAYCDVYDQREGIKGTNPTVAQVVEMLTTQQAEGQVAEEPAQEPAQELVTEPSTEETETETPAAKKRR
jgi:hypothetical protein